jgi:hypothetical protein
VETDLLWRRHGAVYGTCSVVLAYDARRPSSFGWRAARNAVRRLLTFDGGGIRICDSYGLAVGDIGRQRPLSHERAGYHEPRDPHVANLRHASQGFGHVMVRQLRRRAAPAPFRWIARVALPAVKANQRKARVADRHVEAGQVPGRPLQPFRTAARTRSMEVRAAHARTARAVAEVISNVFPQSGQARGITSECIVGSVRAWILPMSARREPIM